jgi:hypothetical protein
LPPPMLRATCRLAEPQRWIRLTHCEQSKAQFQQAYKLGDAL